MAQRKLEERLTRSLNKISDEKGYSVTLPVDVIRRWGWQKRQKVQLSINNNRQRIIIQEWKP